MGARSAMRWPGWPRRVAGGRAGGRDDHAAARTTPTGAVAAQAVADPGLRVDGVLQTVRHGPPSGNPVGTGDAPAGSCRSRRTAPASSCSRPATPRRPTSPISRDVSRASTTAARRPRGRGATARSTSQSCRSRSSARRGAGGPSRRACRSTSASSRRSTRPPGQPLQRRLHRRVDSDAPGPTVGHRHLGADNFAVAPERPAADHQVERGRHDVARRGGRHAVRRGDRAAARTDLRAAARGRRRTRSTSRSSITATAPTTAPSSSTTSTLHASARRSARTGVTSLGPAVAITGPTVAATVDTPTPTLTGTASRRPAP